MLKFFSNCSFLHTNVRAYERTKSRIDEFRNNSAFKVYNVQESSEIDFGKMFGANYFYVQTYKRKKYWMQMLIFFPIIVFSVQTYQRTSVQSLELMSSEMILHWKFTTYMRTKSRIDEFKNDNFALKVYKSTNVQGYKSSEIDFEKKFVANYFYVQMYKRTKSGKHMLRFFFQL